MIQRTIKITFVYPPIPIRTSDYCAYFEGEEENGHYGYGSTPQKALQELLDHYGEEG